MNKTFPVRCAINQPEITSIVGLAALRQVARTHVAQQMMDLIDAQAGWCRIVDSRRKGLGRDVNNDAKRIRRILFESTFLAQCDGAPQCPFIESFPTLVDPE